MAIGPTDKSLVAAQKVLAPMRENVSKINAELAVKDAERKLAHRMIHTTKSPVAGHELSVTFQLRNIVVYGDKYKAKATFTFLSGKDSEKKNNAINNAIVKFRESIVNDLNNIQTTLFKEFWKRCEVEFNDRGPTISPKSHVFGEVKQKFRQWIIDQLSTQVSSTYQNFHKAVKIIPR